MGLIDRPRLTPMIGDPDDHRPNTRWGFATDPHVDDLGAIVEEIAPGDRIPLHTHPVDEVILYRSGRPTITIGDERHEVTAGAIAFVPAGTPHRTENLGDGPASVFAVFPSTRVGIRYLERNPAPGTEDDEPQPPMTVDFRTGDVVGN